MYTRNLACELVVRSFCRLDVRQEGVKSDLLLFHSFCEPRFSTLRTWECFF